MRTAQRSITGTLNRNHLRLFVISFLVMLFTGVFDIAEAVIGRPLTPYSYAGVARRTVRRSTYDYHDEYNNNGYYHNHGYRSVVPQIRLEYATVDCLYIRKTVNILW